MKKYKKITAIVIMVLILCSSIIAYASYDLKTTSDSYYGYTLEGYASCNKSTTTFYFSGWSDTYYTLDQRSYLVDSLKLYLDCYKNGVLYAGYYSYPNNTSWVYSSSPSYSYSSSDSISVFGTHQSDKGSRSLYLFTFAN